MIDYLLSGELLKELDHNKEPVTSKEGPLDYTFAIDEAEFIKRKAKGRAHAFAVSGQHTTTGRPILVGAAEDLNRLPGKYYLVKLQWGEGGQ